MVKQFTLAERLRYRFDDFMSRGTVALIGGLAVMSLVVVILAGLIVSLAGISPEGGEQLGFLEAVWASLMRTLDAGTMGGDAGWGFRVVMLGVTFGGIFVISTLIGVLNNGIEAKLSELRKGRSVVAENGHTIILGWSSQVFTIVSELALANANQKQAAIAILAERDKVEMEDAIRDRVGAAAGRTRVICRTGNPIEMSDLEIVNPYGSKSIIVLAPTESAESDSRTIKTILALTNNPNRRSEPYHIVAEIRDPKNLEVARLVGRDEVELLLVGELISRIAAQTCRQSGLSVVYTELLDFGGDEIYFHEEPKLAGKTFGEALLAYETSTLIGLRRQSGGVQLKPPMDALIQAGDKVIAISQDDDTVRLSDRGDPKIDPEAVRYAAEREQRPERTLILGWNRQAPTIIIELDNYVAPGSQVMVVADYPNGKTEIARDCSGVRNQSVAFYQADTTDRRTLDALGIQDYGHVITLSYRDSLEPQEADARTLVTLLHLRDIASKIGQRFSIVSEMLDIRNRQLAEVTRADDFIVSDRLISLMLSQISENKELAPVFADLFDPEGAELYLKPAGDYVLLGRPVDFYTVVESARRRGEVAIGYRLAGQAGNAAESYGVKVNPVKSNMVTFAEADRVIVLADE
jgi:voltage-gated potassium channel Kch